MTAVYDFLPHNWIQDVTMTTAWSTQVNVSEARNAETRRSLVASPTRYLDVRWTGLTQAESARLLFNMVRLGGQEARVPLYQDVAVTTAASSGSTINCPTSYRRFYDGNLVCIFEDGGANIQFGVISSFTASAITLTGSLSGSFPAGSLVFPVLITQPLLGQRFDLLSDQLVEVAGMRFKEAAPRIQAAGDYGDLGTYGFSQLGSFAYLLDFSPEWRAGVSVSMSRLAYDNQFDRLSTPTLVGARATLGLDLIYSFYQRSDFFRFLQFFDAHRGRGAPFWLEFPQTIWTAEAVTTTYLDVTQVGDPDDYSSFVESIEGGSPFLLIKKTDGSSVIVQVTETTSPGGGVYRLAATIPSMSLSDIDRVGLALFVRFASDELEERWYTDEICEVSCSVIELLRWEDETDTVGNDGFFSGGIEQLCD